MNQYPFTWTEARMDRLRELWPGDNDLSEDQIGARIGCSGKCAKSKAFRMGLKRHPNYMARLKAKKHALMTSPAWLEMCERRVSERRRVADWPPHRFEDDEWEATRPFCPDLRFAMRPLPRMDQTYGGVPSGWAA